MESTKHSEPAPAPMASKNTQCEECSKTFQSNKALSHHVTDAGHMSDKFCVVCRRFFKTAKELERHERYHPMHSTQESPGQGAPAGVAVKKPPALPKAGTRQATESSGARKPSKPMDKRQEVANGKISDQTAMRKKYFADYKRGQPQARVRYRLQ